MLYLPFGMAWLLCYGLLRILNNKSIASTAIAESRARVTRLDEIEANRYMRELEAAIDNVHLAAVLRLGNTIKEKNISVIGSNFAYIDGIFFNLHGNRENIKKAIEKAQLKGIKIQNL